MNKKLTALAVLGAVLALTSAGVIAKKFYEVEYVYMDNSGDIVGERTYLCSGGSTGWGVTTTKYYKAVSACD